jgi:hypothetical protein
VKQEVDRSGPSEQVYKWTSEQSVQVVVRQDVAEWTGNRVDRVVKWTSLESGLQWTECAEWWGGRMLQVNRVWEQSEQVVKWTEIPWKWTRSVQSSSRQEYLQKLNKWRDQVGSKWSEQSLQSVQVYRVVVRAGCCRSGNDVKQVNKWSAEWTESRVNRNYYRVAVRAGYCKCENKWTSGPRVNRVYRSVQIITQSGEWAVFTGE